jgi:putative membrane protein
MNVGGSTLKACSLATAVVWAGTLSAARAGSLSNAVYFDSESASAQPEFLPIAFATAVPLSHADRRFMEKALQVVRDEMRLSGLAVDRAANDHVRDFAQRIFRAQTEAEKTLTVMAASKGLTPRNDLRSDRYFGALSEKQGEDFDLYFVAHLIDVEDDTIALFEKSAQSDDADIAAFASRTLASLEEHMREAKQLERELRGNR